MKIIYFYGNSISFTGKIIIVYTESITFYNNFGAIYESKDNNAKAMIYYEKAFNLFNDLLGPDHPDSKFVAKSLKLLKKKTKK